MENALRLSVAGAVRVRFRVLLRIALRRGRRLPIVVFVLLLGAVAGTLALLVPGAARRRQVIQWILSVAARGLLVGFGLDCDWLGPVPRGPALIAGNHLSWIDIVAAIATWPCTFVAKREVRDWPVLGRLAAELGVVFVDRARKRDLLTAIPAIEQALGRGALIVLFPEGTTSDGRGILRFRTALFEAAVRAGAPVFPFAVIGSVDQQSAERDVRERCSVLCWVGDETLVANVWRLAAVADARFALHAGAPIDAGTDRKALAARVRQAIERRFVPVHARERSSLSAVHADRMMPIESRLRVVARRTMHVLSRVASTMSAPVLAATLVISLTYAVTPIYRFAEPRPFTGTAWYNPYDGLDGGSSDWRLSNFHAHSSAWAGLTNGEQTPDSVVAAYRRLHYDVIGVSNYESNPEQRITGTFPVYEHGWNVRKAHQIVLGPDRVVYRDFPFMQSRHQQQYMLDELSRSAAMVAIAHPTVRAADTPTDLRYLTHYDLLEVLSRFSAPADSEWDAALSSGHAVWLLASDDSHNAADSEQVGANSTRIHAPTVATHDIIDALKAGHAYGLHGVAGRTTMSLRTVQMRGDTLDVQLSGVPDTMRIVGQHGAVRAISTGAQSALGHLRAVATAEDGYLRVVAHGDSTMLYTNPVIRWNGRELPRVDAVIDWPLTIAWRGGWSLAYAGLAAGLFSRRRRATRPAAVAR